MKRSIWSDEYLELRKILKSMRIQAKLTQLELAVLLEKPRTYVTKYENADRNLDFIEIVKVCLACQTDLHMFLDEFIKKSKITPPVNSKRQPNHPIDKLSLLSLSFKIARQEFFIIIN